MNESLIICAKDDSFRDGRPGFDPWIGKIPLEKGKATYSSILTWRILWSLSTILTILSKTFLHGFLCKEKLG